MLCGGGRIAVVIQRARPVVIERLTQPRDVRLEGLQRGWWKPLAPKIVDQGVRRDDLIPVQQQNRQQRALLVATQPDRPPFVVANLERAKNTKVHTRYFVAQYEPTPRPPATTSGWAWSAAVTAL
jgi:hypothetical protein